MCSAGRRRWPKRRCASAADGPRGRRCKSKAQARTGLFERPRRPTPADCLPGVGRSASLGPPLRRHQVVRRATRPGRATGGVPHPGTRAGIERAPGPRFAASPVPACPMSGKRASCLRPCSQRCPPASEGCGPAGPVVPSRTRPTGVGRGRGGGFRSGAPSVRRPRLRLPISSPYYYSSRRRSIVQVSKPTVELGDPDRIRVIPIGYGCRTRSCGLDRPGHSHDGDEMRKVLILNILCNPVALFWPHKFCDFPRL